MIEQKRIVADGTKIFLELLAAAVHDKSLLVCGEGLNIRDWLYVEITAKP